MQLSKLENSAFEELKKNKLMLFKARDLCLLLKINRVKAYNIIKSLKKKNAIKSVGKNFFSFKETDEFIIGSVILWPSYISFWSALSYYGFSDQMPKKIFFVSTKYSKQIGNFKYITLSKKRFFGYVKIGDIIIADKEKAIIDSLLLPKYAGGIKEVDKCLKKAVDKIDINKLIDYAIKIESKAVLKRLGFLLEQIDYKKKSINKLRKNIGKGYELLDPSLPKKNNLNNKWLLDINR